MYVKDNISSSTMINRSEDLGVELRPSNKLSDLEYVHEIAIFGGSAEQGNTFGLALLLKRLSVVLS